MKQPVKNQERAFQAGLLCAYMHTQYITYNADLQQQQHTQRGRAHATHMLQKEKRCPLGGPEEEKEHLCRWMVLQVGFLKWSDSGVTLACPPTCALTGLADREREREFLRRVVVLTR